ncbi:MAG: GNAT family N-acetyltransferase [Jatrophihabitantaceae bacterium]
MQSGIIAREDPRATDVTDLLSQHLVFANSHSPPEDVHALDLAELLDPAISFFSYRVDGRLLAVGALRQLDPEHGEVKSMHTLSEARGQGIGRAMLEHLIGLARERGYRRLSLETGSMDAFESARALYSSAGFARCEPFADYRVSPNSACFTLLLNPE